MNVIVIYHHPQECGDPFLTFISQETGEEVDTVYMPEGYSWSGNKQVIKLHPVEHFTEKYCRMIKPVKGKVVPRAHWMPNPNGYEYVVTKVTDLEMLPDSFPMWKATLHVDACKKETIFEYSKEDDTFLHQMEESGFDMTHWELPNRERTEFKDFLLKVTEGYKGYHPISVINIG